MPSPSHRERTSPAWISAIALLAAILLLAPPPPAVEAGTPNSLRGPERAALDWLEGQYSDGAFVSGGALADLLFALSAGDAAQGSLALSVGEGLAAVALDYVDVDGVDDPGRLGKALLGLRVGEVADDSDDLTAQLEASLRSQMITKGADAGRFGEANIFAQALAVLGLAGTSEGAPQESTQWLVDQRCPEAGWRFAVADSVGDGTGERVACGRAGDSELDTTSLVVQAIATNAGHLEVAGSATEWLAAQQADNGSFDDNANSTGLAANTLRSRGQREAADAAGAFVATLQKGADDPQAGAIAYTAEDDGSLLLATTQGVLAMGAPGFADMMAPPPDNGGQTVACLDGQEGVTVVVDLTFFDAGVVRGCAPGNPSSGLEALRMAVGDVDTNTSDFGEFVCAIRELPEQGCDQAFEGEFWGYYQGLDDGTWQAYEIGADTSDPVPGDVEGWAYSANTPPSVDVPNTTAGPATGCDGVAVVVDLTAFDEGVQTGCADGDPASGLDALRGAGFALETQTGDFGEFVCAINGFPEDLCEHAFDGSYWAYFQGRSDGWESSQVGADTVDPAPGDVEGWVWSGGTPPAADVPGTVIERLAAQARVATAIRISQDGVAADTAGGVVLTRADDFADALAGTPLAAAVNGPLLITPTNALPDEVAAEVKRVLSDDGTVYLLGGLAAIGSDVEAALTEAGLVVERIEGRDRIETAIAVATAVEEKIDALDQILLTTGFAFADALAAGTAAAATGDAVVVLTGHGQPHPAVDAYLAAHPDATASAVGGPAAAAYPKARPIVGPSREGTAVAVAHAFFDAPPVVGVARRDGFADALAGGVDVARRGGPLLITPTESLAAEVRDYVCGTASVRRAIVFGGEGAVSAGVGDALIGLLEGSGCA